MIIVLYIIISIAVIFAILNVIALIQNELDFRDVMGRIETVYDHNQEVILDGRSEECWEYPDLSEPSKYRILELMEKLWGRYDNRI